MNSKLEKYNGGSKTEYLKVQKMAEKIKERKKNGLSKNALSKDDLYAKENLVLDLSRMIKNRYTGEMVDSYTPEEDRRYNNRGKENAKRLMNIEKDSHRKYPKTISGMKLKVNRIQHESRVNNKYSDEKMKHMCRIADIVKVL